MGAYRQAIATFEKLSRAQPTASENESALYASHCYLGLEHYRKGKFHPAIVEFEKALQLRSDMPQLHYNLALSYARLNNFSRQASSDPDQLWSRSIPRPTAATSCWEICSR